jgi:uncharacterized metal-binding protein YceD (DUF177 family)
MSDLPFSRPVSVSDVPANGRRITVTAEPAERAALAQQLHLPAIKKLVAYFEIKPWAGGGLAVTGELEADVVQICGVTLDEFDAEVREEIEAHFVEDDGKRRDETPGAEHEADLDAPDMLENGRADLGALAAEHLSLGLDPYPRKPGVEAEAVAEPEPETPTHRPFAGLDKLLAKKK